jgi:CHAT domain-containing protein
MGTRKMSAEEEKLLHALEHYVYDETLLVQLQSSPVLSKVAIALSRSEASSLGPADFESISKSGGFLLSCGQQLRLYGMIYGRIDYIELALTLFEASLKNLDEQEPNFASAIGEEAASKTELAKFGIDPITNLLSAIDLHQAAARLKSKIGLSIGISLAGEGYSRYLLAELGVNVHHNLDKAVELLQAGCGSLNDKTYEYALCQLNEGSAVLLQALISQQHALFAKAINLFEEARQKSFKKDRLIYGGSLGNEANARVLLAKIGVDPIKNLERAVALNEEAEVIFPRDGPDYASARMNKGKALLELASLGHNADQNAAEAEMLFLDAERIFSRLEGRRGLLSVNLNLGSLFYLRSDYESAYGYLSEAILKIEDLRLSAKKTTHRRQFFEIALQAYDIMVFTCLALGKNEEAFEFVERSKGRTFHELIFSKFKGTRTEADSVQTYESILERIAHCVEDIKTKKIDESRGASELRALISSRDAALKRVKNEAPEYYNLERCESISLPELRELLRGKTLVEYFLGSELAIFVENAEKPLFVQAFKIKGRDVIKKIREFRLLIQKPEWHIQHQQSVQAELTSNAEELLRDLYDILIKPIKQHLTRELVIIPHRHLHLIPFQCLKQGSFLIEEHEISFAQSATSLKFLTKSIGAGALVVGNPTNDLPWSQIEAVQVAECLNTTPLLRDEASKSNVIEAISDKRMLHFACHGYFDPMEPSCSGILLSDGRLTASDFMKLNLEANVTVLSACQTAVSDISGGDELEGLVRSIHYAGSRFVIASLWNVQDLSTKELFFKFYGEPGDVQEKLRNAELTLMKECSFYLWSAFQVYGI